MVSKGEGEWTHRLAVQEIDAARAHELGDVAPTTGRQLQIVGEPARDLFVPGRTRIRGVLGERSGSLQSQAVRPLGGAVKPVGGASACKAPSQLMAQPVAAAASRGIEVEGATSPSSSSRPLCTRSTRCRVDANKRACAENTMASWRTKSPPKCGQCRGSKPASRAWGSGSRMEPGGTDASPRVSGSGAAGVEDHVGGGDSNSRFIIVST